MERYLHTIFSRRTHQLLAVLIIIVIPGIIYYFNRITTTITVVNVPTQKTVVPQLEKIIIAQLPDLSKDLNLIDLQEETNENFTCMKTKYLLRIVRTTICLHDDEDAISSIIRRDRIWEERFLIELLGILIRYPQLSFIDAGANVGTYTMFAASFGRFVLAIECFKPNIIRLRKAVQIEKVQDRVVIVGNAIFTERGKYLEMRSEPSNVGSQGIIPNSNMNQSTNHTYAVKTIQFDDILPILKARNVRHAIMKVDIQASEAFLCQTGNKTFDYVNIPIVLMEWEPAPQYRERMRTILSFFFHRKYIATSDLCTQLNENDAFTSWPGDVYWIKLNRSELC